MALAAAGLSGLATAFVLSSGQQPAIAQPAIPPGVTLTSWFENGKGGQHVLQISEGTAPLPGVRLVGTVTTDTDCDPDAQGLNHCRNNIDLGNGRNIAVIHNHAMHNYPCLEPGQKLSITRLNGSWVVAQDIQPPRSN
ncbi:MAG TPA: hypothetical protein VII92_05200 [Anaerolineae bacterium]